MDKKTPYKTTICKVFSRLMTAAFLSPLTELAKCQKMLDMDEQAGQQRCNPDKSESGWREVSKCTDMLSFPPGSLSFLSCLG